jgi:flavin-binding protein dodecin
LSHRFVLVANATLAWHCQQNTREQRRMKMSVARVTEITSSSSKSFEDAMRVGVARATKTLQNVTGAWLKSQEIVIDDGKITEYRVRLKVTFILKD